MLPTIPKFAHFHCCFYCFKKTLCVSTNLWSAAFYNITLEQPESLHWSYLRYPSTKWSILSYVNWHMVELILCVAIIVNAIGVLWHTIRVVKRRHPQCDRLPEHPIIRVYNPVFSLPRIRSGALEGCNSLVKSIIMKDCKLLQARPH